MYPYLIHHRDFSIQFAETDEQRQSALRIRFEVMTKELGRLQYANLGKETYSDPLDLGASHIILAEQFGVPAGTLRFTLRGESPFLDEDERLFKVFLDEHGVSQCAIADRGAILKTFRSASLYPAMWSFGFEFARSNGVRFVLGVIDAKNAWLNSFHESQGWTVLNEPVAQDNSTWNLIVKEL